MKARAMLPQWARIALRPVYFPLYRLGVGIRCWYSDRKSRRQTIAGFPIPPARLRFRIGETTSLESFSAVGVNTVRNLEAALQDVGNSFANCEDVLDFGCGCGRTLMWLTRSFPGKTLHGTDVDETSIRWCADNLPGIRFGVNHPLPPIQYPDRSFDLIFGVSVFTHINETHQSLWLPELLRILKPGGLALLSLHGRPSWGGLTQEDHATLRDRGFLFKKSAKLRGILPDWYQTAYHSQEYVERTFSKDFEVVKYKEAGMGFQDVVILRRPRL